MRKIFVYIFLFIFALFQSAFADEMFRIKDVSFDTSSSFIFLNTYGTYQTNITDNIKLVQLKDDHKIYFDINSSILVGKKQDVYFSSGAIKQFKLSQFSTNPNIVRCVIVLDDNYNLDNLKIGNINNNIVIMNKEPSAKNAQFYQNTYRDKPKTAEDYYCTLQFQKMVKKTELLNTSGNHTQKDLVQIRQAFESSNAEDVKELVTSELSNKINIRSKYYLTKITTKNGGFLVNGYGALCIQKPFILENPSRMVFDLVNSDFNQQYHNQEIFLEPKKTNCDCIRIGRFDNNTTRIVITSPNAKQYMPIFSPDNQSILLINPENLSSSSIISNKTNITKYKYQKNLSTDDFTFTFDQPVVWSLKRNNDKLYVYFFNAVQYNENMLKIALKDTPYEDLELALLKNIGIRLTLPLTTNIDINTYFSADGKNFRIRSSGLKPSKKPAVNKQKNEQINIPATKLKGKIVVIDAGHGGTDYGAIREGINEKDINLDVAKRVEDILHRKGIKVCMTRSTDTFVSLEDRSIIANEINPLLFVSIHVNSCMGTEPRGIETHYYHDNSIELADIIHTKMINTISTNNRGLFKSKFYVINHTLAPAVLLEIGFISNTNERNELITPKRKQATAQAIAEGIIEYIGKHK